MSKFQKIKNFGPSASVVSFAYFQAFKFPDSMNVHFQCVIQVCRYNCPEPKCGHGGHAALGNEYGLPGPSSSGSGEYGPPHLPEYGVPPASFVDPRHPADASGAFSENQETVVPPPQAQTGPNANSGEAQSDEQQAPPSAQQQQQQQQSQNEVHLPPPPPPGQSGYSTVRRKDTLDNSGNLMTLGGRPRSVEGLDDLRGVRRRRETETMSFVVKPRIYKRDAQEMTDVNTSRTIQVVSPGDVNFALNNAATNETIVVQSARTVDPETICMSVPSFVGGLVMLLLVLAVASLVAAFLFVRVRHFDRKGAAAYVSEFMKVN
jgi:hypothetical protein